MQKRGRETDGVGRDGFTEKGDSRRSLRGSPSSAWLQLTEFERDQKKKKQREKREKSEQRRFGISDEPEKEDYCEYHQRFEPDVQQFVVGNREYWLTRIAPRVVGLCPNAYARRDMEELELKPISGDDDGQVTSSSSIPFQDRAAHLYPERRSPYGVSDSPSPQSLARKLFGK